MNDQEILKVISGYRSHFLSAQAISVQPETLLGNETIFLKKFCTQKWLQNYCWENLKKSKVVCVRHGNLQ